MLIDEIMEKDITNCFEAISKDPELQDLEKKFYKVLKRVEQDICLEVEGVFNAYMAQVTRICYLQGLKDFAELHLILKESVTNILKKYVQD